jgi:hypothetical protein
MDAGLKGRVPLRDRLAALRAYAGGKGSLGAFARAVARKRDALERT